MHTRRTFLSRLFLAAAALAMPGLTGCSTARDFAVAFIASAQAVVNADPNASYVPALNKAIADAQTALANWNDSSANCALTSAANDIVLILDSIVSSSQVALIATVAIAGFDALAAVLF